MFRSVDFFLERQELLNRPGGYFENWCPTTPVDKNTIRGRLIFRGCDPADVANVFSVMKIGACLSSKKISAIWKELPKRP